MYREIQKKKLIIENRKPFKRDVAFQIREMDLVDMIYTTLRLSGHALDRDGIRSILSGEVVREASIFEHTLIENYKSLQNELSSMVEMSLGLSMRTILKIYALIIGETPSFRKSNPVLREYAYVPPHYQDVEEQMNILLSLISKDGGDDGANDLKKIAYFHNRFIEIYPFEERNEEVARLALYLYLMSKGYPIFAFGFSHGEYQEAIASFIKNEDIEGFYRGLERSLYNKLDIIQGLTEADL